MTQPRKTAVINVFIDPETGFLKLGLSPTEGGSLYVSKGEEVAPIMGEIIEKSRNTTFILGQDYHPANHISFMTNHPGIMEYRIKKYVEFLEKHGHAAPADTQELYEAAQQPVHFLNGLDQPPVLFPFNEVVLDEDRNIIGLKEDDGRIRRVRVDTESGHAPSPKDRGRVTKVTDEYMRQTFDEYVSQGTLYHTQTLWTVHCVQGTDSSLYPAEMKLPKGLTEKLSGDLKSDTIHYHDPKTGNDFYVIRKGTDSELDSYGIGVENDGDTFTQAPEIFREIGRNLKRQGYTDVEINVGGLASNFCVEFSANNIADFLAGQGFKMRGMGVTINYVPEISRGIPIPGGADVPFSADGVAERLKTSRGIGTKTVSEIKAQAAPQQRTRVYREFKLNGQ